MRSSLARRVGRSRKTRSNYVGWKRAVSGRGSSGFRSLHSRSFGTTEVGCENPALPRPRGPSLGLTPIGGFRSKHPVEPFRGEPSLLNLVHHGEAVFSAASGKVGARAWRRKRPPRPPRVSAALLETERFPEIQRTPLTVPWGGSSNEDCKGREKTSPHRRIDALFHHHLLQCSSLSTDDYPSPKASLIFSTRVFRGKGF